MIHHLRRLNADLVKWLGLNDHADDVLVVTPGQPFRLKLWKHLALAMHDPDVQFLDTLQVGVPLGVRTVAAIPSVADQY